MSKETKSNICGEECEVYSRVCGYYRPVARWNRGKAQEFKDRVTFEVPSNWKVTGKLENSEIQD